MGNVKSPILRLIKTRVVGVFTTLVVKLMAHNKLTNMGTKITVGATNMKSVPACFVVTEVRYFI